MLIRFFRSSFYPQYILLFVVAALLWGRGFFDPCQTLAWTSTSPLSFLLHDWGNNTLLLPAIGFILTIANAILLNQILIKHELISRNAVHGVLAYLIFASQAPESLGLNPVLIASLFIILAVDSLLSTYDMPDATKNVFSASFLVSLASLFYFPAIFLLLIIFLSLVVFGTLSLRMIMVSITGILAIYLYLAVYYFMLDRLEDQYWVYVEYVRSIPVFSLSVSIYQYVLWGLHLILFAAASLFLFGHINEWNISNRRKSILLFWFGILAIAGTIPEGNRMLQTASFSAVPLASLLGIYLSAVKKPSRLLEATLIIVIIAGITNNLLAVC